MSYRDDKVARHEYMRSPQFQDDLARYNELATYYFKLGQKSRFIKIGYDERSCVLWGSEILINLPHNSNQAKLCEVVFKNLKTMKKKYDSDELLDKYHVYEPDKDSWRIWYNAAAEINKRVDKNLPKLFLITTKTLTLNPDYFPQKYPTD